jgi:hypothetical protein
MKKEEEQRSLLNVLQINLFIQCFLAHSLDFELKS